MKIEVSKKDLDAIYAAWRRLSLAEEFLDSVLPDDFTSPLREAILTPVTEARTRTGALYNRLYSRHRLAELAAQPEKK